MNNIEKGRYGEFVAKNYIQKKLIGRILAQNFRNRMCEIDIIYKDINGDIVFVEVKSRTSNYFGLPSEAVGKRKKNKIVACAKYFLAERNLFNSNVRFDVVEVYLWTKQLRYIKDAIMLY